LAGCYLGAATSIGQSHSRSRFAALDFTVAYLILWIAAERKSNVDIVPINGMNFADFDLNLQSLFDRLTREQSATRAGERLGLSQPR
jgi:hypothetical protein